MRPRRAWRWREDGGTAAVEFALVMSLVSLMLIGVADFGMAYYRAIQLSDAVNYATTYGLNNTDATLDEVEERVTATVAGVDNLTVDASLLCRCDTTDTACSTANEDSCESGGGAWRRFIVVEAEGGVAPVIAWPGIPDPIPLSASAMKVVP